MPTIGWGEWRPDISDLDGTLTRSISNVIPRADGYGPARALASFTEALGETCRGLFYARNNDGSVTIFGATEKRLHKLNNTTLTWSDVSAGGTDYTALAADAQWQFAQFNNIVIAVHANEDPQKFNLLSDVEFSTLSGSPPKAAYVSIINQFVVLSGLASNPTRVQWSAIGDVTGWTAGTDSSDFQDLPDGGTVRQVVGGELGIILQDFAIRRMVFAPGSDVIFTIDRIAKDEGVLAPYSVCSAGNLIFFLSPKGFMRMDTTGGLTPIGLEKVDRTFFDEWDSGSPHLMFGVSDPRTHRIIWFYKTASYSGEGFNKALVYDLVLNRFAPFACEGEFATSLSRPGLTLEGLDAIAPGAMDVVDTADNGDGLIRIEVADTSTLTDGHYYTLSGVGGTTEANGTWKIDIIDGTHFDLLEDTEGNPSAFSNAYTSGGIVGGSADAMTFPWDDISVATLPNVSVVDTAHRIAFLSGDNLEAILETPEQSMDGRRMQINGFWPITDAATVKGSISKRENLNASLTYTPETTMNGFGFCPLIRSTRYARAKIRIPAGTTWTYASGVRPDAKPVGQA